MKGPNETHIEVGIRMRGIFTAVSFTRFVAWNIYARAVYSSGKPAQVINEMHRYDVQKLRI